MSTDSKINTFMFSVERACEARKDVDLRIDALESRLDNIIRAVTLGDVPVITLILQASHDPQELEALGNAVVRVSKIIEPLDKLKGHKALIDFVEKDTTAFVGMFGDFTNELDALDDIDAFLASDEVSNPDK